MIEPETGFEVESRTHAVSITPVSVEECGIVSVEGCSFLFEDVDGYAGAVLADGELAERLDVAKIDGGRVTECGPLNGSLVGVVAEPLGGRDEAGLAEEQVAVVFDCSGDS